MSTVDQFVGAPGGVASLPPSATVLDASRLMNDRHIGSVVLVEDERLVGIFTERDVLRRVVAAERSPAETRLAEVMTCPVACAAPHTTIDEVRQVMREKRIRHLPIVDGLKVLGMVSIGDVNRVETETLAATIHYLEQYISVG